MQADPPPDARPADGRPSRTQQVGLVLILTLLVGLLFVRWLLR